MKVPFSGKVATKLLFLPILLILAMFAIFCAGFYYLSPWNPFEDAHKRHLINLLSEKKLAVDMLFEQGENSVAYLADNNIVREAISAYNTPVPVAKKQKKVAYTAREMSEAAALRLFDNMVTASPCKMFALLSRNGKIISGSQRELIGSDWSDRDFFTNAITGTQSPSQSVRVIQSGDGGMVFLAPVFDDKKNLMGFIYAVPNIDKISRLLHVERGMYKTEKVEMIDREGNLILTQKGFPDKKIKFNLPKNEKVSGVRLKANLFFYVVNLESAPFRLIATIDKQEVMLPLSIVLALGAIFSCLTIIVLVFQSAYSGPKLISRPVARLVNASKSITEGGLDNIDLGKEFKGELLELKRAFESMVEELKNRESVQERKLKAAEAIVPLAPFANISSELRRPLYCVASAAEGIIRDERNLAEDDKKVLYDMLCSSKSLLILVDNLYDYAQFSQEKVVSASEPFSLCELVDDVSSTGKELAGMKEIEVITDCQEVFMKKMIHTDRSILKKLLLNLMSNAVGNTGVGTITVLCSEILKDGIEYIEISVADTGKGFGNDEIEHMFEDMASPHSSLGLIMSRKMAEILGGSLEVESLSGKGSVFTAIIPVKAIVY
ncbi:MAG: sensor histidine kinase [Nitrospirae bacterium]|nr:sensor histidine kinase [Nitrospirota bacterium]